VVRVSEGSLFCVFVAGLGELIQLTTDDALKPFVIQVCVCVRSRVRCGAVRCVATLQLQITGPLIRVIGDRFPWQVKAAILKTLTLMITKARPLGIGLTLPLRR
jgi:hypothetical protein